MDDLQGEGSIQTNDITSEEKGGKNGASWAFELGGDLKVCPIIVEDLQYPGHMIIEVHIFALLRYKFTYTFGTQNS